MTTFREKPLFREGILKPGPFSQNYELHCYEPCAALKPFVEHYFVSRRRSDFDLNYCGRDVLSQPVVSIFFKQDTANVEGPTTGARTLKARETPFYAGVQFKPGGFYPFYHQPVSELAEKTVPIASIMPSYTESYVQSLVDQTNNHQLLTMIETNLLLCRPQRDANIDLVNAIIGEIESRGGNENIAVSQIADTFNISERTIQHLFNVYVGVGVKWSIMRVRFLEMLKLVRYQEKPDWTVIAAEFRYSDQAHFIHDFKRLVGVSPAQFMTRKDELL
jgi:AraC-like DNA-binding protein